MKRRRAFTLLEMLLVIGMLTLTIGFGGVMLLLAMRSNDAASATLRDLGATGTLADRFRSDVARAVAAPEQFDEWRRSPACLILQMTDGHMIYRADGNRIDRIAVNGETRRESPFSLGSPDMQAIFEGSGPTLILRIIESSRRGTPRSLDIVATLSGDRR